MKNYINTGLFCMDIRKYNSDIAHLYEHLLIRKFQSVLVLAGFSPYLYGWVEGETYRNIMFIDYGLYNPKVEELFLEFMGRKTRIDYSFVDLEIARIGTEALSTVTVLNKEELIKDLARLDKQPFINLQENTTNKLYQMGEPETQVKPELFTEKRSKKSFRKVAVVAGIEDMTLEEKAIFLRLTPILTDCITNSLYDLGMYGNDYSGPKYNSKFNAMLVYKTFTIRRSTYSNYDIQKAAAQAIANIDLSNSAYELQCYLDGFLSTPNWATFPLDYFRDTGMVVSKKQICELITADNVHKLLERIQIKVVPAKVIEAIIPID